MPNAWAVVPPVNIRLKQDLPVTSHVWDAVMLESFRRYQGSHQWTNALIVQKDASQQQTDRPPAQLVDLASTRIKPLERFVKIVPWEHLYLCLERVRISTTNKVIVLIAWLESTPPYWEQHRALLA